MSFELPIRAASKNEGSITFNTKGLNLPSNKKGTKYIVTTQDGLDFVFYVNRVNGSTCYCPKDNIPKGFKGRMLTNNNRKQKLTLNVVSIRKVT